MEDTDRSSPVPIARLLRILAAPGRLKVLGALGSESLAVSELARRTGFGSAAVGAHLRVLRSEGLVRAVFRGRRHRYQPSALLTVEHEGSAGIVLRAVASDGTVTIHASPPEKVARDRA